MLGCRAPMRGALPRIAAKLTGTIANAGAASGAGQDAMARRQEDMETGLDTFPRLLLHHAQVRGNHPAVREKDLGIWQTFTWRQVADEVRALACGLVAQGFER